MQSSNTPPDVSVQMALRQPPILQTIFDYLQIDDIKSCSLVNQAWNDVAYVKMFNPLKIGNEKAITSFTIEKLRRIFKEHGHAIKKLLLKNVTFTDGHQFKHTYCIRTNITANLTSLIIINDCVGDITQVSLRVDYLTGLKCLRLDSVSYNFFLQFLPSKRPFRLVDLKLKGVIVAPCQLLLNDFIDFGDAQKVDIDHVFYDSSTIKNFGMSLDLSERITVDILKLNNITIKNANRVNWKYKQTVELGTLMSDKNIPLSISLKQQAQ